MCGRYLIPGLSYDGLIVKEAKGHRFFPINTKIIQVKERMRYVPAGLRFVTIDGQRHVCKRNANNGNEFLESFVRLTANLLLTGAQIVQYFQGDCQSIPLCIQQLDAKYGLPGVKPRQSLPMEIAA